jgi:hypothetical protein
VAIKQEDLARFVEKLLALTESKRVQWQDTPDEDQFRSVLKEGAVIIERISNVPEHFFYRAILLNSNDQPIAELQSTDAQQQGVLRNLFNSARNSALKVEDVFRKLLVEINQL